MTEELEQFLLATETLDPAWRGAFRAVPRADYLPDVIWPFTPEDDRRRVDRAADPDAWARWAEADVPITVQWDDGATAEAGEVYTSSASMPSLVAAMLRDLDSRPGMRVLEIGTGTGWNAALLCERLGAEAVTTVEVDASLAERARARLRAAGYRPVVVAGDGLAGCPDRAPYDRVIATVGVRAVPVAWIDQTRPGGVILAPWGTHFSTHDALARLVVAADGSASGQFTGPAQFMKARSQRRAWPDHEEYVRTGDSTAMRTDLDVADLFDPGYGGTGMLLGLLVPDAVHNARDGKVWLYGLTDHSWAAAVTEDGTTSAYQGGPRRLWEEVEAAYRWWLAQGSPGVDRFGLTVHPDGTHEVWLDTPDHPVSQPVGASR
ncbi:methyltransferase domain-containing protein [Streptomonospora sp. S1-112]|uniref:Protein-L-isoaspartate O-methyltransferase n=1 Tax=Streptomonospora mangrovi TaxID=2883123 RepID=A0A9X3SGX1_9ACTN|nr:methyltransferase domain-containing protein [Streptomonospora mangrovi]MDA0566445.1 methyltransferase domain-containing protein [Streptomonospora mangrovi]